MSLFGGLFAAFGPVSGSGDADHFIFRSAGVPTHAGTQVDEHSAMELTPVYSAIGIIADGVAQLPIDIGRKDGETRELLESHPLDTVLNLRANPYMSAFTLQNVLMSHALGWGNGYAEIQRDGRGTVVGLWPLLPDRTYPVRYQGKVQFLTQIDGEPIRLPHERVLHIPALGFDGLCGYSPLHMARQAIGLGKALEEFGGKFFANEAKSGGFVHHPGRLGAEGKKNLSESVNKQGGLDNAHRVKILEEGAKFVPTTIAPEDAQFLSTREFQASEIARLFRVPLFMLQLHSKDTSWGSGIAEMFLGFLKFTLAPWLIRYEQEARFKLLSESERAEGLYVKHNVASLLRGDPSSRAEYYTKALSPTTGWLTRAEVRALEDRNPDDQAADPSPADDAAAAMEGLA